MNLLLSFVVMSLNCFMSVTSFRSQAFDNFRKYPILRYYSEGTTLQLYCHDNTTYPIDVFDQSNRFEKIVDESVFQEKYKDIYKFTEVNSTTVLFTINTLKTGQNGSQLICQMKETQYFHILVFKPIEVRDPRCSSSFGSRFIFADLMTSHFEFNCTSEEGDPPVRMSVYIGNGTEINEVTNMSIVTFSSHPYQSKTLTFSPNLTSSFNNTVFVCNVSQQLPEPYQSYRGSCSFGPLLLLPSFSVSVIPSNITVNDSDDVILTCSSNVSEVTFDWSNIPSDWETNRKRGSNFSELRITDYGSSFTSVIVECVVSYGDRTITEHVNISIVRSHGFAGAVIALICVLLIIPVVCLLVYRYRNSNTKCLADIRRKRSLHKNNSSMNNSNEDNNICKTDEKFRRVDDLSSSLGGGTVLIDNTIYESSNVDKQKDETKMTSTQKHEIMDQDCQMVENSVYESTSVNAENQQSCMNPEYDTLQLDVNHV